MIIPYGTDAPIYHFPWATIGLIAGNCVVFGSIVIGFGCGIVMALIADAIIMVFYRQQASSSVSVTQLVGKTGTVNLTIQPGKFGEVTVQHHTQNVARRAKSRNPNETIHQGESVVVMSVSASEFLVKKPEG